MSDDNVQELRETFIKFEKTLLDPQLPTNTLADKTFSVLHDSKVVLERAMKYIKEKLYPEGKDFLYYPKAKVSQAEGDLKKFFEKECKWEDFSIRYTEMFAFFVEKLDCNEYSFVLDFVNIRNKGEHDLKKTQLRLFDDFAFPIFPKYSHDIPTRFPRYSQCIPTIPKDSQIGNRWEK